MAVACAGKLYDLACTRQRSLAAALDSAQARLKCHCELSVDRSKEKNQKKSWTVFQKVFQKKSEKTIINKNQILMKSIQITPAQRKKTSKDVFFVPVTQ
jgi:hypothetical protein